LETSHSRRVTPFSNNSPSLIPQHHWTPAQKSHVHYF
jgi:hypothetical protein